MSAQIIEAECIRNSDGCGSKTVHGAASFACNNLATWMLQRYPHQHGCWHVSLFIRGLCVSALAVQDDFGNLQMVEA